MKCVVSFLKSVSLTLLTVLFLTGCATSSTIQSRERERTAAYAALSPQTKRLVDQGQITIGMTTNAVYIAWGPPDEVIEGTDQHGAFTAWKYLAVVSDESQFSADGPNPSLEYDLEYRTYICAMVIFTHDVVRRWDVLQPPAD